MKIVKESISKILLPKGKDDIINSLRSYFSDGLSCYDDDEFNDLFKDKSFETTNDFMKVIYDDLVVKLNSYPDFKNKFKLDILHFIPKRFSTECGWGNAYKIYDELFINEKNEFKTIIEFWCQVVKNKLKLKHG